MESWTDLTYADPIWADMFDVTYFDAISQPFWNLFVSIFVITPAIYSDALLYASIAPSLVVFANWPTR